MSYPIYIGDGSIRKLPDLLRIFDAKRPFLVASDRTLAQTNGRALPDLLPKGSYSVFSDFKPVPVIEDLCKGCVAAAQWQPDVVIGIGGGTAMDLAKLIAVLPDSSPRYIESITFGEVELPLYRGRRLILIPTTSGGGAEATHFAVLYTGHIKHSIEHHTLLPDCAIVDPQLTWSMPPYLTACTGFDALSQAIESYWSVQSTDASRLLAAEAIRLIWAALPAACQAPTPQTRAAMSTGALKSGQAIRMTRTTAPHAVSYPLTALFGIPHGHACILTLPSFIRYNSKSTNVVDRRGPRYLQERLGEIAGLIGARTPDDAADNLTAIASNLGLKMRLRDLAIAPHDIETIVKNGFNPKRMSNNPCGVQAQDLRAILHEIY